MGIFTRRYLGRIDMKTSVYINMANEELLKNYKGSKTTSAIINEALELYFNSVSFDNAEQRKKKRYKLVVFRVHEVFAKLLQKMKENFDNKAVSEFVMGTVTNVIKTQTGRKYKPDRLYTGVGSIEKAIEQAWNICN